MQNYKTEKTQTEETFKKCPRCRRDIEIYEQKCPYCDYHFEDIVYPDGRLELVKDNVSYYQRKFEKLDGGARVTWNWMPLLIGPAWYAYRKMFPIALIFIAIDFVITFMEGIVGTAYQDNPIMLIICIVLNLAIWVIMILFANGFYKKKLEKKLEEIDAAPDEDKQQLKQKASGTSLPAAFILVAIIFVIGLIA